MIGVFSLVHPLLVAMALAAAGTPRIGPVVLDARTPWSARMELMWALTTVPPGVLDALADAGWRIELVPTLADAAPIWANERPRGWPARWTWRQVDAMHWASTRRLVIASFRESPAGNPVRANRISGVLRHEIGHAWDIVAGNRLPLSTLPGFRKAYRSDRDAMPDDLRRRMYYFLQPGKSGQQETFAEAFAVALGGGSAVTLQSDFRQAFPRVMAHIRRQLETPCGTVSDASGPPHRRASATPARWRPQPSSGIVAQR